MFSRKKYTNLKIERTVLARIFGEDNMACDHDWEYNASQDEWRTEERKRPDGYRDYYRTHWIIAKCRKCGATKWHKTNEYFDHCDVKVGH